MEIGDLIQQACVNNILCKEQGCQKEHKRMLSGLCIQGLIQDKMKGNCNQNQCPLIHMKIKKLKTILEIKPINGIYKFNICPNFNNECQQNQIHCRYLHPQWANGFCKKFFFNDCEDKEENCPLKLKHIQWQILQQKVYAEFNIAKINPEIICEKKQCNCENHLPNMDKICIQYLKGECPNILCTKQHLYWEKIKKNIGQNYSIVLKPCIQIYKEKNQQQLQSINQGNQLIFVQKENLQQLKRDILNQNIIDIIIIMDLTGSMTKWKEQIHKCIYEIIDKFKNFVKNYSLRVAFVGYRDFQVDNITGKKKNKNHVVFHDFTENVQKIKEFINMQQTKGGGDAAEDLISGLKKAIELNISKHKKSILITFLFTDAPNHGRQYHDIKNDSYIDKIKNDKLEKVMQKYQQLKNKNYFSCVSIKSQTDKMYKIMQQNFKNLTISQSIEPIDMQGYVDLTLTQFFENSQIEQPSQFNIISIDAEFSKSKYLTYEFQNKEEKIQFWKEFNSNLQKTKRVGNTLIQIEQQKLKCTEGAQSYVFKLFDTTNNQYMIAKLPKKVVEEYKNTKQLSDTTQQETQKYIDSKFLSQSIAKQMGQIYRKKTYNINGAPPIFYVTPIIYKLSKEFYGLKTIYAETFIELNNEWISYTRNSAHFKQNYEYFSSFSHFTYQESNRQFVIMDLQGKLNILSDPSIQSLQNFNEQLIDDKTNQIYEGIGQFLFGQHKQCNVICKELNLQREENQEKNKLNNDRWNIHESQNINVICETCDQFLDISQDQYKQQLYQKCEICFEKEKEQQIVCCHCCKKDFLTPLNQNLIIQTNQYKCQDCKTNCRGELPKCNYCVLYCKLYIIKQIIGQQEVEICKEGYQFLKALICLKCQQRYSNDVLLTQEEYEQGKYVCLKCKN